MARTAAAVVIGNELLSGKVQEANLRRLALLLRRLGVQLRRVVMVLDEIDTIAREVAELSATHDVVFTSGGVGPTHDDVTIDAVARAFGVAVVSHPDLEALLRRHYGERTSPGHLRMALVPEGGALLDAPDAPWPALLVRNVWVLPGVPEAFENKLPIVERALGVDTPFVSRAVFSRLDEPTLKPRIDAVVEAFSAVDVGSYPTWSDPSYRTKVTFDGTDRALVDAALAAFVASLPPGEPQRID